MLEDTTAQRLAQEGLRSIEDAILMVLESNPAGLRNAQIADLLNLRSSFLGRQRDYLTYSILGGLLDRGLVARDEQTKLFIRR